MRFTLVSLTLLALAYSLAPGVHGAPAADVDALQDPASYITGVLSAVGNLIGSLLPTANPPLSANDIAKAIEQALEGGLAAVPGVLLASPSDGTPSVSSTSSTKTATPNVALSKGFTPSFPVPIPSGSFPVPIPSGSLPVPIPSLSLPLRMRRQLPTTPPASPPTGATTFTGALSTRPPSASVPASSTKHVSSNAGSSTSTLRPSARRV